jgi:SAM-dependent methyltransferase
VLVISLGFSKFLAIRPTDAAQDAGLYDAKHAFVWEKAKGVLDLLAAQKGESILDLGCGTSQLTSEIAAAGVSVVGVDRSAEMIAEARKPFRRSDLRSATRALCHSMRNLFDRIQFVYVRVVKLHKTIWAGKLRKAVLPIQLVRVSGH